MTQKKCEQCSTIFDAKRKDARYCSNKCRVDSKREGVIGNVQGIETVDAPKLEKEYDREKALAAFIRMGVADTDWISTGLDDFDSLTEIPKGRVTHIFGPEGVGKTTLCLNMIKGLRDKKVFYVDSEAALNPYLLVDLELDPTKFTLFNESSYFEDISKAIQEAARSGFYEMVIFDSLAACTTKAETEGSITDRNIGQKAFFMHKLLHMTQMDFKRTNTAFVIINQERDKIGGYFPEKYTPGGTAVPYAASLAIRLKTTKGRRFPAAKKGAKRHTYEGHSVEAEIIKSKVNQPWRKTEFKLYYPNPYEIEVEASDGKTEEKAF